MGPYACPRHARRPSAGGWAGRVARLGSHGPRADRQALRLPARPDPLFHPVAITEHCVIGDQIRVPAAWCDMAGCRSRFADPAALGETDNRARALAAGWAQDACGRLMCPACQLHQRGPAAPGMIVREPETAGVRTPAGGPAGPRRGIGQLVRSLLVRWHRAASRGRHRGTRWSQMLLVLATGNNGWAAPHRVASETSKAPDRGRCSAVGPGAARHAAPVRPAELFPEDLARA